MEEISEIDNFKIQINLLRKSSQKLINDTYIWYGAAVEGINSVNIRKDFSKPYKIPTRNNKDKKVWRSPESQEQIMDDAKQRSLNAVLIIYFVAVTEAYIEEAKCLAQKLVKLYKKFNLSFSLQTLSKGKVSFLINEQHVLDNVIYKWNEIQQTRHLLVHARGLINKKYLKKSDKLARGNLGELINTDKEYMESCAEVTKRLIGKIASFKEYF